MANDSTNERQTTNSSGGARGTDDETRDASNHTCVADDDARGDEYVGEYDKLVRDGIPAVVRDDGNRPVIRTVDGIEYDRYLAAKLVEEATEYVDALDGDGSADDEDALDELADAYAVLDAVVAASPATMDDVRERAREKATERGGFEDGIVLERIEASDVTGRLESGADDA